MSKARNPMDVYAEACNLLEAADVRYLVIGGMGINLHSTGGGPILLTEDCDLLLPRKLDNLQRAVDALQRAGFGFQAGGEPLRPGDEVILRGILRAQACIRVTKDGSIIDLPLSATGLDFEVLWARHTRRRIDGSSVRVAPLADIVRSKMEANRPKDRLFLETYRDRVAEMLRNQRVEPPPELGP